MKFSTAVFDTPRRQRDIGSLDNKLAPFHWLLNSNRALYVSLALLALASPPAFAVAPVAVDDGFTTDEDTPLNEAAPGVLGNDTDAEGDPLTAVLDVGPASGTLDVFNADGSFTYTPADDFNGSVNFTYHANDGTADSANDPPVAVDDGFTAAEGGSIPGGSNVRANDSDPDDALANLSVTLTGPAPP
jgi:hypothetical protein